MVGSVCLALVVVDYDEQRKVKGDKLSAGYSGLAVSAPIASQCLIWKVVSIRRQSEQKAI